MHHLIKATLAIALAAAMSLPLPASAGKDDNKFVATTEFEVPILDAYFSSTLEMSIIGRLIWDTLIFRDPDTFEFKPLLAESWTEIDGLTIEFKIREGVTFHDGTPLTAEDAVFTFNYITNP